MRSTRSVLVCGLFLCLAAHSAGCTRSAGAPAGAPAGPAQGEVTPPENDVPVGAAATTSERPRTVEVTEPIVQSTEFDFYAARPMGKGVAYVRQAGPPMRQNADLMYYDLETRQERVVAHTTTPSGQIDMPSGDWPWLTWLDWSQGTGQWTVYGINLEEGEPFVIASTKQGSIPNFLTPEPSLSGTRVVWVEVTKNPNFGDLFLYDLQTRTKHRLTSGEEVGIPEIAGDVMVFPRVAPGATDAQLWSWNLVTGEQKELTHTRIGYTRFGGRYLGYTEVDEVPNEGARHTLFLLDLHTGKTRQLAPQTPPGYFYVVATGDQHVIWDKGDPDMFYGYSVSRPGESLRIHVSNLGKDGYIRHPRMKGEQLVWAGTESENGVFRRKVYYLDLAQTP